MNCVHCVKIDQDYKWCATGSVPAPRVVLQLKAVHCIDCGILTGYDYTITQSFCVECGQKRISHGEN